MKRRRYRAIESRLQVSLFPERIEDYTAEDSPVRAIEAFVDMLDLRELGFCHMEAESSVKGGQPPYDPVVLLKALIYGHLNRVRSSRLLEQELHQNVALMWLTCKARPSYRTLSGFRQANHAALSKVLVRFIWLLRQTGLLGRKTVAIDGTFLKGSVSLASIKTRSGLEKKQAELTRLEQEVQDNLNGARQQDDQDDADGTGSLYKREGLQDRLKRIKEDLAQSDQLQDQLKASGQSQISTVDADARQLKKGGKSVAGYNAQTVVDAKHGLVVAAKVVQDGNDARQLVPMVKQAREVLGEGELTVVADAGYYESNAIKVCRNINVIPYVPQQDQSRHLHQKGQLARNDFLYDAERDIYICPNGETLYRTNQTRFCKGKKMIVYRASESVCGGCPLRERCSSARTIRVVLRWEHESCLEEHKKRMQTDQAKEMAIVRKSRAEAPFGWIKNHFGANHLLTRGLSNCQSEFSMMVLAYNFKRVLNLMDIKEFMGWCAQMQPNPP